MSEWLGNPVKSITWPIERRQNAATRPRVWIDNDGNSINAIGKIPEVVQPTLEMDNLVAEPYPNGSYLVKKILMITCNTNAMI